MSSFLERLVAGLTPGRLTLLLAGYLGLLCSIVLERHRIFALELDPSTQAQIIWVLTHGRPWVPSLLAKHIMGDHFCILPWLFTPLVGWMDPYAAFLVLQVVFAVFVMAAAYRFASELLPDRGSACLATLGLALSPAFTMFFLFPETFVTFSMAGVLLVYAGVRGGEGAVTRRDRWTLVAGLLACSTSYESSLLAVVGMGLCLLVGRATRAQGLALCVYATLALGLIIGKIIPYFSGLQQMYQVGRYDYLSKPGAAQVLWATLTSSSSTLLTLLLAGGWFAFRKPALLLPILPGLCVNFLSSHDPCHTLFYHYLAYVIPGLYLLQLRAIANFQPRLGAPRTTLAVVALSLAGWLYILPTYAPPPGIEPPARRDAYRQALSMVPMESSLLVPAWVAAHVTDRPLVYTHPPMPWAAHQPTEWMLLDLTDMLAEKEPSLMTAFTRDLLLDGEFQVRWRSGPVVLLQRGSGPDHLELPPVDPGRLALLYAQVGFHARAALHFREAVDLHPENANLWALLGLELEGQGQLQPAQEAWRKALSLPGLHPDLRARIEGKAR